MSMRLLLALLGDSSYTEAEPSAFAQIMTRLLECLCMFMKEPPEIPLPDLRGQTLYKVSCSPHFSCMNVRREPSATSDSIGTVHEGDTLLGIDSCVHGGIRWIRHEQGWTATTWHSFETLTLLDSSVVATPFVARSSSLKNELLCGIRQLCSSGRSAKWCQPIVQGWVNTQLADLCLATSSIRKLAALALLGPDPPLGLQIGGAVRFFKERPVTWAPSESGPSLAFREEDRVVFKAPRPSGSDREFVTTVAHGKWSSGKRRFHFKLGAQTQYIRIGVVRDSEQLSAAALSVDLDTIEDSLVYANRPVDLNNNGLAPFRGLILNTLNGTRVETEVAPLGRGDMVSVEVDFHRLTITFGSNGTTVLGTFKIPQRCSFRVFASLFHAHDSIALSGACYRTDDSELGVIVRMSKAPFLRVEVATMASSGTISCCMVRECLMDPNLRQQTDDTATRGIGLHEEIMHNLCRFLLTSPVDKQPSSGSDSLDRQLHCAAIQAISSSLNNSSESKRWFSSECSLTLHALTYRSRRAALTCKVLRLVVCLPALCRSSLLPCSHTSLESLTPSRCFPSERRAARRRRSAFRCNICPTRSFSFCR